MLECRAFTILPLLFATAISLLMPAASQTHAADDAHGDHAAALKNPDGSWKYTNALVDEVSPYLLQHAHNPVDWMPWGEEAFERARKEQKPIFLSIGYSTCYWCHVMERQVFENPQLAEEVNKRFVCVKVDREERPDIDNVYMSATQIMTRGGGWPLSIFLTPPAPEGKEDTAGYGLKPFYCATYIPPADLGGQPGFGRVVRLLSSAWEDQQPAVLEQAERLAGAVSQVMSEVGEPGPVGVEMPAATAQALARLYDSDHAGFGGAPKFPQPGNLILLLSQYRHADPAERGAEFDMVLHTLDRMARGGMNDQVCGGFHRYSVDNIWLVPHFEKMLYDNGQLLSVYAEALVLLREAGHAGSDRAAQFERILRETADYLLREMTDPTGAFWSAQDAEVNAREGENYLWTRAQADDAIKDEALAGVAATLYGLDRGTNFTDPHDPGAKPTNVLYLPKPIPELAAEMGIEDAALHAMRGKINAALNAVRDTRDQPGMDDKVLVSWNGLAIKGLAEAGAALNEPRYTRAAYRAADAILAHMSAEDGGLFRIMRGENVRIPAFLEDYTHFAAGLVALYRLDPDENQRYLDHAQRLTRQAIGRFAAERGGYFDTLPGGSELFVRVRSTHDGAVPSGNAVMARNLVDLYQLTGDLEWLNRAVVDLRSFANELGEVGTGLVVMQAALLDALAIEASQEPLAKPGTGDRPVKEEPLTATTEWTGDQTLTITLRIIDGTHINANKVSNDFLTPTAIELAGPGKLTVTYPEGELKKYPYSDQPIRVYDGSIVIKADLTGHGEGSTLRLRYQACTEKHCLPPVTVTLQIPTRPE